MCNTSSTVADICYPQIKASLQRIL